MNSQRKQPRPLLSIIIVNYNVREFLHQSIVSLKKSLHGISSEIIVVDNASDDGSVEMLRQKSPGVRLIVNARNAGFAAANNKAMRVAKGKYFLLINPDTIVQENTIRVMLKFMEDHNDAGLSGCKILDPDGTFQLPCRRGFPTPWVAFTKIIGLSKLFPSSRIFGKYNVTYEDTEETYPVDAVSGSFMFVRREVFELIGGLDEAFFMYGEDLDWCYRIREGGWQVYYVHTTQIIHYRGESTKRSNIDELKAFYEAMNIFVEKHFHSSPFMILLLKCSIATVSFIAACSSSLRPLRLAVVDWFVISLSLIIGEFIRRGKIFAYPGYAYPVVFTVPAVIVIAHLYAVGVYTYRPMSISRSFVGVASAYIIISALTAFFKDYAFSRAIVVLSGVFALLLIPGWRFFVRLGGKTPSQQRLLGSRTAIVGTNAAAQELLKKIRTFPASGYEVVGFFGTTHKDVGTMILNVPVLASIENVNKMTREHRISDVIFAPDSVSYTQMLWLISHTREQNLAFHLVPNTMEVVVGKGNIDVLDQLPLVQLSYNINRPFHRVMKRLFDIVFSGLILITVYPILRLFKSRKTMGRFMLSLSSVFNGSWSFVGTQHSVDVVEKRPDQPIFIGKEGITGLVQLQAGRDLTQDEIAQYDLYYARNQSMMMDVEILLKAWIKHRSGIKNKKR